MSNIQNIPLNEKLRDSNPKINQNFQNLNSGIGNVDKKLSDHIKSTTAHKADDITYTGQVPGEDVKEAIDNVNGRISEIVAQAGNDNTEIVDSRGGYPVLGDRLNAADNRFSKKTGNIISVLDVGVIGDGETNDTAAFGAFEASVKGAVVDLGGKIYAVDSVPVGNAYYNGTFKIGNYTRPAMMASYTLASGVPKFHRFGGQLKKLKKSLSNPLEQYTGIVFIGDSITWGLDLGAENGDSAVEGVLSDPRDVFMSPSFVNTIKRYIGEKYAQNVAPVLSNWSTSSSGEAIAEYTTRHILFPYHGDFTLTTVAPNGAMSVDELENASSITGYDLVLGDGDGSGSGYHSISFNFTGDTLTLSFTITEDFGTHYDLIVDGVNKGTFSAKAGVDGFVAGYNQQRTHTFGYVRDKVIEIRTNRKGETGVKYLRIEGLIVDKTIRITNNGIIGQNSQAYVGWGLLSQAITNKDNYVICQLGTNDRARRPRGQNEFKHNLKTLIDLVIPSSEMVLMCANPVLNEDPSTFSFTMQSVRGVIYNLASENNIDMIDNYAVFENLGIAVITDDGLHPNKIGHQIISRNIIGSLEMA